MTPLFGCSNISAYKVQEKLGEGTFGHVYRGVHGETGEQVALKEILLHNKSDGMPITALREIRILKKLQHPNVIKLLDMTVARKDKDRRRATFSMVTPYMDHDLAGLLQNDRVRLNITHIKCYMQQLLEGINYLHQSKYMHRDIKAANILLDNRGQLKIADFGLAREYLEGPPTVDGASPSTTKYTGTVVTRWYRPPELLLGEQYYTTAIDMWGIGCILGEIFTRKPIFPGRSDSDQVSIVFRMMGSPTEQTMPGYQRLPGARLVSPEPTPRQFDQTFENIPPSARALLERFLDINPATRISALAALQHEFFPTGPPACAKESLPIYTSSHEMDARRRQQQSNYHTNQQNHRGTAGLPDRPARRDNRRRRALDYKIPRRPALYGMELIAPYRRNEPTISKSNLNY